MSDELPDHFPCWPCIERAIFAANRRIPSAEDHNLDRVLFTRCYWLDEHFQVGKCTPCADLGGKCGCAPGYMHENVKDFVETMAYINMVTRRDRPEKVSLRLGNGKEEMASDDASPSFEDRVLPFKARKDLIAATVTLGMRLTDIIVAHFKKHPQLNAGARPRRLDASDEAYLLWNAIVHEFHYDVLKALQNNEDINERLRRTIIENITIQWTPAANEEALEAAKDAMLAAL